jgi:hypothetical protein
MPGRESYEQEEVKILHRFSSCWIGVYKRLNILSLDERSNYKKHRVAQKSLYRDGSQALEHSYKL